VPAQGRDGLQADCVLFFSPKDRKRVEEITQHAVDSSAGTESERGEIEVEMRARKQEMLDDVLRFAANRRLCRRTMLLRHFGERALACGVCDVCVERGQAQQ